ncbi:hypothetical protein NEFER03_1461 [Nematocida sp. LUAm3]|nr:hypothetical protein NEFER03_1461 [Nematocida sp. LUAm3]KAI5174709.1 hypothetical protein NEFER02_0819 [Nematocida sp. LUAm2]KAI5177880.1 hypothetical protein NEFER01_1082 [Nematocida sp. LUAm1]
MSIAPLIMVFPFRINSTEHKVELETRIIRKENVVTFSLPFYAHVSVASTKKYTVHYTPLSDKTKICVSVEFKSINDAISFEKAPEIHLSYAEKKELLPLDEELEKVSLQLERTNEYWKKRKRSSSTDNDGYQMA